MICNYVYEHVEYGTSHTVRYTNVFPQNRLFDWVHVRRFRPDQNLLMHSVMYRTEVLRECGMVLPKHTFYVDNIFVYQPLPFVKSMYYMDLDLYRYFIGRADQSVNESVMVKRVDQQLRVTRHMIDCQDLDALKGQKQLRSYMREHGLTPAGPSREIALIDDIISDDPATYVTQITVPVVPAK